MANVKTNSRPQFNERVVITSLFLIGIFSATMVLIKPLVIGAIIDSFGYTPADAGFIVAMEMVGTGLATFLIASLLGKIDRRITCYLGALMTFSGHSLPLLSEFGVNGLALVRFLAGFGEGMIIAVVFASFAAMNNIEKILSRYFTVAVLIGAVQFPLMGQLVENLGANGVFGGMAAFMIPVTLLIRFVPTKGVNASKSRSNIRSILTLPAIMLLAGWVFFFIGVGGVWAFLDRFGTQAGVPVDRIGLILGLGQLFAAVAATVSGWVMLKYGRRRPFIVGMLVFGINISLLTFGESDTFLISAFLMTGLWFFLFPILSATTISIDPTGRLIVLGISMQTVGMAIGPWLAGNVAHNFGYSYVVFIVLFSLSFSLLLYLLSTKGLRKHSPALAGL